MDPWNLKVDDTRLADSLPTFIIFCEGEINEPVYLRFFETSLIKINIHKNQKSRHQNFIRALAHCVKEGLINQATGEGFFNKDEIQVWCIFDRDKEGIPDLEILHDIEFSESIRSANYNGINVAWSNDAFELWILLHFEDIDLLNPESINRSYYYQRLTDIFSTLQNPNEHLARVLASPFPFSYKNSMKGENNFRYIVRDAITKKTNDAINRAKILEEYHLTTPPKPDHEKAPCTTVHHLMEELLRLGGKNFELQE